MTKRGPSTKRERETLLILRQELPEYEINPHMRLANVVRGRLKYTRAMGQYEMDFVVMDPDTGQVVCAIELDDPTHDTEEGRRRDGNKNGWMAKAKIKLIRIREPVEALHIRDLMNAPIDLNIPEEIVYAFEKRHNSTSFPKFIGAWLVVIVFFGFVLWGLNAVVKDVFNHLSHGLIANQQQRLQQIRTQQTEAKLRIQQSADQEAEQAEARRRVDAEEPHYVRMLVKGKSARECSKGGVIDNSTVACMNDHYEMVLVNGNQQNQ